MRRPVDQIPWKEIVYLLWAFLLGIGFGVIIVWITQHAR
jgi:hypothetical protein